MAMTALERLLRDLTPQVLRVVYRRCGDFAAAEDAVQEALLAAATQWLTKPPELPLEWLVTVASRRVVDAIRSDSARRRREDVVARDQVIDREGAEPAREEAALDVLLLCGNPVLSPASAIALALRAAGGLTTAQIGAAFLVPEATMAQRISRAKRTLQASFSLEVPHEQRLRRLGEVLHVLYLMFNEGYSGSGSELLRPDLSQEALRLTRLVHRELPDVEVKGLLALMLLTDARRKARTHVSGELIPLEQQNRSLWDRAAIAEGQALLTSALPLGRPGPYQIQAAIAALHAEAADTESTDWRQILAFYDLLCGLQDNPVAKLNRVVAAAMVYGPSYGLELLDALVDTRLAGHHRPEAVRAHLLEKTGDLEGAAVCYRRAAARTSSLPERNYLLSQAGRMADVEKGTAAPTPS